MRSTSVCSTSRGIDTSRPNVVDNTLKKLTESVNFYIVFTAATLDMVQFGETQIDVRLYPAVKQH